MPKERTYDSGVMAPRTGHIAPVGTQGRKWGVDCYECDEVSYGRNRREAIEQHEDHYEEEHGE